MNTILLLIAGFAIGAGFVGVLWTSWVIRHHEKIKKGLEALNHNKTILAEVWESWCVTQTPQEFDRWLFRRMQKEAKK